MLNRRYILGYKLYTIHSCSILNIHVQICLPVVSPEEQEEDHKPVYQRIHVQLGREIGRWLSIWRTNTPSDHNKKTPKISLGNFKSNPPPLKKFFVFPDKIFLQNVVITQNLHITDTTKKSRHLASVTKNVPSVSVVCRFGSL